jgi:hypothetical protein
MSALPTPVTGPEPVREMTDDLIAWLDAGVRERIGRGAAPQAAIDGAIAQARQALVSAEEEFLWRQRDHHYRAGRPRR